MCHVTDKLKGLPSCDDNYIGDGLPHSLPLEEQSASSTSVEILSFTPTTPPPFCDAEVHSASAIESLPEKSVREGHRQDEGQNQGPTGKDKLIQEL